MPDELATLVADTKASLDRWPMAEAFRVERSELALWIAAADELAQVRAERDELHAALASTLHAHLSTDDDLSPSTPKEPT